MANEKPKNLTEENFGELLDIVEPLRDNPSILLEYDTNNDIWSLTHNGRLDGLVRIIKGFVHIVFDEHDSGFPFPLDDNTQFSPIRGDYRYDKNYVHGVYILYKDQEGGKAMMLTRSNQ